MRIKRDDAASRCVTVDRLDDSSYVLTLSHYGEGDEANKVIRLSSNNIDSILKDIKDFLKVDAPF